MPAMGTASGNRSVIVRRALHWRLGVLEKEREKERERKRERGGGGGREGESER